MSLEALPGFCSHVLCDLSYVSIVTFGPWHIRVVIEVCRVFEQGTLLFQLEFQVGHNGVECKFAPVLQGALTGVHPDTHKHLQRRLALRPLESWARVPNEEPLRWLSHDQIGSG